MEIITINELENEMRIILNDELFLDENYLELTKVETDRLFRIVALFAKEDKEDLPLAVLRANFDISDEFLEKLSFCLRIGKTVSVKKYFTWFKGNKVAAAKSRSKVKSEPLEENTSELDEMIEPLTPKRNIINYDRIKDSFNEAFKGTKVDPIRKINPKRQKQIKSFFDKNHKELKLTVEYDDNIYAFYETYWEVIKDIGDLSLNLVKGWSYSAAKNGWFQPDFDYYLKDKVFYAIDDKINGKGK
jgi:hypothetical protein